MIISRTQRVVKSYRTPLRLFFSVGVNVLIFFFHLIGVENIIITFTTFLLIFLLIRMNISQSDSKIYLKWGFFSIKNVIESQFWEIGQKEWRVHELWRNGFLYLLVCSDSSQIEKGKPRKIEFEIESRKKVHIRTLRQKSGSENISFSQNQKGQNSACSILNPMFL